MALWQADAICDARQAATVTVKIVRRLENLPRAGSSAMLASLSMA